MGAKRNGARSFLDLLAKVCKLSHLPGFRIGLANILGASEATSLFALWDPLCAAVDILVASDNWFNKLDHVNDDGDGEDEAAEI